MKVLVIGATGKFAGLVVPELKKKGVVVRALVQDTNKAAIAKTKGADETVLGNLEDEESLVQASKGMDGVFHIIWSITLTSGLQKKRCIDPGWIIRYCNRQCICRCWPEAGKWLKNRDILLCLIPNYPK
jgi:hypothetical protein